MQLFYFQIQKVFELFKTSRALRFMTQKIIKNTLVEKSMSDALRHYCDQVSILKKGYAQEKYRIDQMCASFLGSKLVREITSVDIASYRDLRLSVVNPRNNQTLSTSTVRLEMSLLSNFFDICRIEWGFVLKIR